MTPPSARGRSHVPATSIPAGQHAGVMPATSASGARSAAASHATVSPISGTNAGCSAVVPPVGQVRRKHDDASATVWGGHHRRRPSSNRAHRWRRCRALRRPREAHVGERAGLVGEDVERRVTRFGPRQHRRAAAGGPHRIFGNPSPKPAASSSGFTPGPTATSSRRPTSRTSPPSPRRVDRVGRANQHQPSRPPVRQWPAVDRRFEHRHRPRGRLPAPAARGGHRGRPVARRRATPRDRRAGGPRPSHAASARRLGRPSGSITRAGAGCLEEWSARPRPERSGPDRRQRSSAHARRHPRRTRSSGCARRQRCEHQP